MGSSVVTWSLLGAVLGPLESTLEARVNRLGLYWAILEAVLGSLGRSWGNLGQFVGALTPCAPPSQTHVGQGVGGGAPPPRMGTRGGWKKEFGKAPTPIRAGGTTATTAREPSREASRKQGSHGCSPIKQSRGHAITQASAQAGARAIKHANMQANALTSKRAISHASERASAQGSHRKRQEVMKHTMYP